MEKELLKNEQRIQEMCLMDDDFMSKVFEDVNCVELLLQIILKRDDLEIESVHGQHVVQNLQGRSIRMDIWARDKEGKIYNIEVQRKNKGAHVKRARYNSSLIDANVTEAGDDYSELEESYVIFITEKDSLRAKIPICHVERMIIETGEPFGDEEHIIFVNSEIQDDTELGKLMHDFYCTNYRDMNYQVLADRVKYFKEETEGIESMGKFREEIEEERSVEIAERLLQLGKNSYEDIATCVNLPLEEIKQLAGLQKA